jgi:hypothetical protein
MNIYSNSEAISSTDLILLDRTGSERSFCNASDSISTTVTGQVAHVACCKKSPVIDEVRFFSRRIYPTDGKYWMQLVPET